MVWPAVYENVVEEGYVEFVVDCVPPDTSAKPAAPSIESFDSFSGLMRSQDNCKQKVKSKEINFSFIFFI